MKHFIRIYFVFQHIFKYSKYIIRKFTFHGGIGELTFKRSTKRFVLTPVASDLKCIFWFIFHYKYTLKSIIQQNLSKYLSSWSYCANFYLGKVPVNHNELLIIMKCWGRDDLVSGIILVGVFRAMSGIAHWQTVLPDKIITIRWDT